MIRAGRVTVNGKTVTELGTRANPHRDRIAIDGKLLRSAPPPVYILLHKPVGVMTTLIDPGGRTTVRDLLGGGIHQRVFPVGRLDYHSAGLLLLTNDGELALRLTHPRYGIRKTYEVKVKGRPEATQLSALARGVNLPDGRSAPATVRVLEAGERKTWLSITLAEGKNRQVRRMCDAVGLPVEKLTRVALGPLELGKLPPGAWRHLEPHELAALRAATVPGGRRDAPPAVPRQRPPRRRRTAKQPMEPRRHSAPQSPSESSDSRGRGQGSRGRTGAPRPRRRADSR
jgi:23S rRNA pseudouridine2605 synthase